MNEFERRLLDVIGYSSYIATFADPARQILGIEGYAYSVDALAANVTSAAPADFDLIMDSDSDFVVCYLAGAARIDNGPTVANGTRCTEFSPGLLVQITDQSSGKTYFDKPTPLPLIAGAGGFPYIMSSPRVIKPRSTLTVTAQGAIAGAQYDDFFFALHGAKVYYA